MEVSYLAACAIEEEDSSSVVSLSLSLNLKLKGAKQRLNSLNND